MGQTSLKTRAPVSREEMLEAPILPLLLRLAAPTTIVIAAQTLVAVAETFWLARLGAHALAGAALVLPMIALMTTVSNGGVGGGVSSAMARALGAGDREAVQRLLWHAILIALAAGAAFTALIVLGGPLIYSALGGRGATLEAALVFSNWVFAAAVPMWLVNIIAAALRGAGDPSSPARVALIGAVVTAVLSPVLIFGLGPSPALGVAGAGLATALYYIGAALVLLRRLQSGHGVVALRPMRPDPRVFSAILKVGFASAAAALLSSLTAVVVTGAVGLADSGALAGYGVASRLDALLVPLLFGPGTAVIAMVGTAVGAGRHDRARAVTRTAVLWALVATEALGLTVAIFPGLWIGLFSSDPAVVQVAASYLRIAAPSYGALAVGLTLYFAAQGSGRVTAPMLAAVLRLTVAAGGGWIAAYAGAGLPWIFAMAAAGMMMFGLVNWAGHALAGVSLARAAPAR
jgi:putative MATE family efflux protein